MKLTNKNIVFILVIVLLFIFNINSNLKYKLSEVVSNVKLKIITKNMDKKKLDNITYYYSNKNDEIYINNIKEYVKKGEEKVNPILGQTIMYPYNIILFTSSETFGKEFKVNPKQSQALTIFDSLYIPCDNINSYVFVHEYTHYKMNSFCKEKDIQIFKIPSWFQEGVSEYASSTLLPNKFKNAQIKKVQDFKKLETSKQMTDSELNGQESYMQSYMAVRKIIELKGQNSIKQILINTKSMSFYNAFEKVVGLSIGDFQRLPLTDSVDDLLELGWKYSSQKDLDKAKNTFLEYTKKYPDSELAWLNLGHSYVELGDFNNAIKSREKLISIAEKKSIAYFYYSQLFIATDLDKAIEMSEKSAQLAVIEKSDDPKFFMNYFLLIKSLKDNINSDKLLSQYVTLIESDYLHGFNKLKIDIINHVLAKFTSKNYKQKEKLIKLKNDLENQK